MSVNPSRRVWFVSDTHFGHDRIRQHCRPQFSSVGDMDETIIDAWCSTVGRGDLVYHLGDFAWNAKIAAEIRPRLTGTIRLLVGNHDDVQKLVRANLFQTVSFWRVFPEYGFHACHVPLPRRLLRHASHCVHGHVHGRTDGLEPWHRDVSVESLDGCRPIAAHVLKEWVRETAWCGVPDGDAEAVA